MGMLFFDDSEVKIMPKDGAEIAFFDVSATVTEARYIAIESVASPCIWVLGRFDNLFDFIVKKVKDGASITKGKSVLDEWSLAYGCDTFQEYIEQSK